MMRLSLTGMEDQAVEGKLAGRSLRLALAVENPCPIPAKLWLKPAKIRPKPALPMENYNESNVSKM